MPADPTSIGRYQVLERLGRSGRGALYLARDPAIERSVAIKLLQDDRAQVRERFAREARAAGQLRHANIVTIFDVGEHLGDPFIAMEYIPGRTLADLIRDRAPLTPARKLALIEDVCAGLTYAHRAGVVHRHITPENLIVDPDGVVKILDFGIARVADSQMTVAGSVVGTLNYMAPEQMSGRPVDHRTDIFAVGAVCYELLTHQQAFPGTFADGILQRVLNEEPTPLRQLVPELDPEVARILATALAKDPSKRYQDTISLRGDLSVVRQRLATAQPEADRGTTVVPRDAGGGASVPTPAPDAPRRADRDALARRRDAHIEESLRDAQQAMDRGDLESALAAAERGALANPDEPRVLEIIDRIRDGMDVRQALGWRDEARAAIARGSLTAASGFIDKALEIRPADAQVLAVRRELEQARVEHERGHERERMRAALEEQQKPDQREETVDPAPRDAVMTKPPREATRVTEVPPARAAADADAVTGKWTPGVAEPPVPAQRVAPPPAPPVKAVPPTRPAAHESLDVTGAIPVPPQTEAPPAPTPGRSESSLPAPAAKAPPRPSSIPAGRTPPPSSGAKARPAPTRRDPDATGGVEDGDRTRGVGDLAAPLATSQLESNRLLEVAHRAFEAGAYKTARDIASQVLRLRPNDAQARSLRTIAAGKHEAASLAGQVTVPPAGPTAPQPKHQTPSAPAAPPSSAAAQPERPVRNVADEDASAEAVARHSIRSGTRDEAPSIGVADRAAVWINNALAAARRWFGNRRT